MNFKPLFLLAPLFCFTACDSAKNSDNNTADSTAMTATLGANSLVEIWTTDSTLRTPESVLFDRDNDVLYVAQIDGDPSGKDGKGGVGKLGTDGKVIDLDWVMGLNAPKGMGMHNSKLFVADLTEVVEIDIASGKVLRKIPVSGSVFLNDVTANANGDVFVSDSKTKQITMIKDGKATKYFDSPNGPNGLLALSDGLLILDSGTLYKLDADKKLTTLAEGMDKSTDGIEEVSPGEYVVSCWAGEVYYVKDNGSVEKMLDTKANKINAADIGYDAAKKIVYVPTFFKNSVVAYQLK